ncbi:MAG: sugar ABC transporter permease [Candidatus Methanomethylicaceae archaeon]
MKLKSRETLTAYIFLIPIFFIIFSINLYPLARTFYLSLFRKVVGSEEIFIGFKNYISLFASDVFWKVVTATFVFVVSAVPLKMLLGMAIALILNKSSKLKPILRSIVLLPWALPVYVSAYVWVWLYNPSLGLLNKLTEILGLGHYYWLQDYPMPCVVITNVWQTVPFLALALLAALQSIKKELYESAAIDGATSLQQFLHITLPSLKQTLYILTSLQVLWTFGEFVTIWILTAGGPGYATKTLPIYIYEKTFISQDLGIAATLSMITLPIFLMIVIYTIRLLRGEI